jgi:Domain of unknown function (DUF4281)
LPDRISEFCRPGEGNFVSDQLFSLAGMATLGWALLIFLPRWRVTRRMAELEVFPIYLAILYLVGVVPLVIAAGPGIIRDFGNADGVANLLARRDVALIAWIHILAFDQVVGVLIYRDNMSQRYVPVIVQSLVLCLTFLFGPVGYLAYSVLRIAARRRQALSAGQDSPNKEPSAAAFAQPMLRDNVTPRSALRLLFSAWSRERALFATGATGLALGAIGLASIALRGRVVAPEGDLMKAASFDIAVGIYLLTIAIFVNATPFTQRGRRTWRGWQVTLGLISYAMESIQIGRGIDPRFTHRGSLADQLGGGFFLLIASGILVLFAILFTKFPRSRTAPAERPLVLAVRYACAAMIFGFGTGYLMTAVRGSQYGVAGNILPLHALGFHSLQALPLVALFFLWSDVEPAISRRWIHLASLAWIGACVAVAWQMFAGRSPLEFSPATFAAVGLLLVWMVALARGAWAWRSAMRGQTAAAPPPRPVLAQSR